LTALLFALVASSVWGQAPSTDDTQRLREQIAEQQKLLQTLQQTLDEQQKKLDALTTATPVSAAQPVPAPPPAQAAKPVVASPKVEAAKAIPAAPRWYEKYTIRGYTQLRDNRVATNNRNLTCEQCDRNIGNNTNFSFRRARMILSGDVSDRVALYFQSDFATPSGGLNFAQIRDLYADVALDKKKEFRIRAGQSKVPYGFENMQSSQNRLALDRDDAINTAAPNERDLGAFFYWAPAKIRTRLATLSAAGMNGLKGSGDYGVLGIGVYNGQSANRAEANNNAHVVARAAYPWQLKSGQYIEAGLQAYTGRYTVTPDQRSATVKGPSDFTFTDRRIGANFVVYPQPWGFQAEYNVGKGPRFDPASNTIFNKPVRGGYAQTMYMKKVHGQVLTPFYRYQYYSGGKKQELDARSYLVRDNDFGVEWQQSNFFEITAQYSRMDRTYEDAVRPNNRQKGSLLRLQFQINY
jgi:uncharacterized coiled-coil protein SlyX